MGTQLNKDITFGTATKLHEILKLALDDLALVELDNKYKVNMSTWHRLDYGVCNVCLAGSVIAKSLRTSINKGCSPGHFGRYTSRKLYALDCLRVGNISRACEHMKIIIPDSISEEISVTDYEEDEDDWWADMRSLLGLLERANI